MMRGWLWLAWSQGLTSIGVGTSLILRPPTGKSAFTMQRIDELAGGIPVIGSACVLVGVVALVSVLTGYGIRLVYGLGAVAFTSLAASLAFAAVFAGAPWAGACLAGYIGIVHLLVVRWAAMLPAKTADS